MPLLTAEQLHDLRSIIEDAATALAVTTFGDEVPEELIQHLVDEGWIDPETAENLSLTAFTYGQLLARLPEAANMSPGAFRAELERNPVALSAEEREAVALATQRAGQFCRGLGNRYSEELGRVVIDADAELAQRMREGIQDETATALEQREGRKTLVRRLRQMSADFTRDWDRIAQTETHMAREEGLFEATVGREGDAVRMAKVPEADACSKCLELYLDVDGKPRVMPASWWRANGTSNVGRKRSEWLPVLGAVHPWCRCRAVEVPAGWEFDDQGSLVPSEIEEEEIEKAQDFTSGFRKPGAMPFPGRIGQAHQGGPFIGPRGGKWADPEHTIHWEEGGAAAPVPKIGDQHTISFHPKTFGREQADQTFHVVGEKGGKIQVSRHPHDPKGNYGPWMHKDSLKHFKNDLAGKVDLPLSGRPELDAVIGGKAAFLGKGDDGLAFRVGDKVVKVSTTVPYQPENPGHRTPQEASDMLRGQVEVGNKLADAGVKGIQRSEFVQHGDKGFQIKPWAEIPPKWTQEQLDKVQAIVKDMHAKGYALHDAVQAGLDSSGEPVMFDVGKAEKFDPKQAEDPVYSPLRSDDDNVRRFVEENGGDYVRQGTSEGQERWDSLASGLQKDLKAGKGMPAGWYRKYLGRAAETLREEARKRFKGDEKKIEAEIASIDFGLEDALFDVETLEKKGEKPTAEAAPAKPGPSPETSALAQRAAELEGEIQKSRKLEGRVKFAGFDVSIENDVGSVRHWHNKETGEDGTTVMKRPYGYIRRTEGVDGDHVDVFLGPDENAAEVYVVTTRRAPDFKRTDEQKVMLGFADVGAAVRTFLQHYDDPRFLGEVKAIGLEEFRKKVHETLERPKLIKSGGPYIGPRGGKWADPQHTISWHESLGAVLRAQTPEEKARAVADLAQADHETYSQLGSQSGGFMRRLDPKIWEENVQIIADPAHPEHEATKQALEAIHQRIVSRINPSAEELRAKKAAAKRERAEAAYEAQGIVVDEGVSPEKLRGKMVWLYHGTSDKHLPYIRKEGLRTAAEHGRKRSNVGSSGLVRADPNHVYLSARAAGPASAEGYARAAAYKTGGNPVILRVLVSGDALERDPDDKDIASGAYQYVTDRVTPEQIKEVGDKRLRKADGQLELFKAAEFSGYGGAGGRASGSPIGTMGNWGDPARTPGDNVMDPNPVDGYLFVPPKQRKKRKRTRDPEGGRPSTPTTLQDASERFDMGGVGFRASGGWANPPTYEQLEAETPDLPGHPKATSGKQYRETLENYTRERIVLRDSGRIQVIPPRIPPRR